MVRLSRRSSWRNRNDKCRMPNVELRNSIDLNKIFKIINLTSTSCGSGFPASIGSRSNAKIVSSRLESALTEIKPCLKLTTFHSIHLWIVKIGNWIRAAQTSKRKLKRQDTLDRHSSFFILKSLLWNYTKLGINVINFTSISRGSGFQPRKKSRFIAIIVWSRL